MSIEKISPEDAMALWCAALVSVRELAVTLERLGPADEDESLHEARRLRPRLLEAVEAVRGDAS